MSRRRASTNAANPFLVSAFSLQSIASAQVLVAKLAYLYPNQYSVIHEADRLPWGFVEGHTQFPDVAKHEAGYQLELLQRGEHPLDFKSMPSIGAGVEELRIWEESGTYRVVYTARRADAIFVLHAFQKRTQRTTKRDIQIAKDRFRQLPRELK